MRRFNYEDNEEYREDVDKFFAEGKDAMSEDEIYKTMLDDDDVTQQQMQFVDRDLNHRVLRSAIRLCEKSFWWRFYSHETRLNMVEKTYKMLKQLEDE